MPFTSSSPRPIFRLTALAAGLLLAGAAAADARLDPALIQRLQATAPGDELQVVISYTQSGPVNATQTAALRAIGIERAVTMRTLPIAGALATPAEIQALAARDDVASIYLNAPLRYFNREARQISGAARATDNPADFNRAIPFSGYGVTVMVNDSGIDATHPDLKLGEHVVENVLAPQNILANVTGIVPITQIEGVPNTDLGSGHGTHCAGTVGGTGQASQGRYRGAAPGADLVGYGSGGVLLILDAVGGLDYAATHQFSFRFPIRVTSNSWGTSGKFDPLNPVNISTYELYKRGIVSVFAAGNDGPGEDTHNPYAQAPWVISVGAGEKDGVLTAFSSRGKRGETGTFTMPDGRSWTYINQPTVVATGVDIISTRAPTGALPALAASQDATLDPAALPFYTFSSGTSMATPHVAGVIALMLEANPGLTPQQVKDIIARTSTNMTARLPWEAGFGHLNAYAAVAEASSTRFGWGGTVNALRSFNSSAVLAGGVPDQPFALQFSPVGTLQDHVFQVGSDIAFVSARALIGENTLAISLIDPDGVRYGSSIALPVLGDTVTTGAPGKPGTWRLQVRGIGSLSGTDLDPLGVTNGYGLPGTVEGSLSFLRSGGYTGLNDVAGHPAQSAIEYAIANRLMDGLANGTFKPDQALKRGEMAQYLLMGASVRQQLPLGGGSSVSDVGVNDPLHPFVESVVASGGALRDLQHDDGAVMGRLGGAFRPNDSVTRVSLAYSLVQAMGLQDQALAFQGTPTAFYDGRRIPLSDAASIPTALRGHVQVALDQGLINVRFALTQGPFDLQPTVQAYFDPSTTVTRAAYAVAASRFDSAYRAAED